MTNIPKTSQLFHFSDAQTLQWKSAKLKITTLNFDNSLQGMGLIPTKTWTLLESLQRRNSYKDKKIAPNFLCNKSAHQAAKVHPLINWLCQFNIRTEPIPTTESNETLFWNILPASSTGGLTGGTLALLKCSASAFAFLTPSLGGTSRLTQRPSDATPDSASKRTNDTDLCVSRRATSAVNAGCDGARVYFKRTH